MREDQSKQNKRAKEDRLMWSFGTDPYLLSLFSSFLIAAVICLPSIASSVYNTPVIADSNFVYKLLFSVATSGHLIFVVLLAAGLSHNEGQTHYKRIFFVIPITFAYLYYVPYIGLSLLSLVYISFLIFALISAHFSKQGRLLQALVISAFYLLVLGGLQEYNFFSYTNALWIIGPFFFFGFFVVSGLFFLAFMRYRELAYLRKVKKAGIEFCCPSCSTDIEPVYCHCPSCSAKHKERLIPSKYGSFKHKCEQCKHELPTQLKYRDALNMMLYCPHCSHSFSNSLAIDKCIISIGGGTDYFGLQVQETLEQNYGTTTVEALNKEGDGTDFEVYQIMHKGNKKLTRFQLFWYDIINYELEGIIDYPFFKNADAIVFLLDARSFPKLKGDAYNPTLQPPIEILDELHQILTRHHSEREIKSIPLHIILTGIQFSPTNEISPSNPILEQVITSHLDNGEFVLFAAQCFGPVTYHPIKDFKDPEMGFILESIGKNVGLRIVAVEQE